MFRLNNLSSAKGAHKKRKRLGRGQGSGQGTQAGKGHKGQKARSGGGKIKSGFEGGQMPLYRRLPKKGFLNAPFKTEFAIVNCAQLSTKFAKDEEVSRDSLIAKGLLSGRNKNLPLKILGQGTLKHSLTFSGIEKFSKTAKEMIEKAGGKITTSES